ncbi:hypothetical protein AMTRI_Chr11g158160 [Amborella trichopoda]|uniref:AP2/ERF domain-containing protein n=1 Tax=Amborella trichopoda TaxID=13333 RepID=W1NYC1_AMBTC|nr:ethylene-responsive transcription factor ERF020 [Amborella trichopoda]ERM99659.1 hypothetical protein AMTR_s00099p00029210 [Amborella trichopoda]|eukprot:XP_006836806.1 ethylene-responsive transcription factor ERF020 [Amborella trichopoda]
MEQPNACRKTRLHRSKSDPCKPRYKGIRQRQWGKWVSEVRIPKTGERLWLGTYNNAEAAATAHDTAMLCLRGPIVAPKYLNFPNFSIEDSNLPNGSSNFLAGNSNFSMVGSYMNRSPTSIKAAARDAGAAADAELERRLRETGIGCAVDSGTHGERTPLSNAPLSVEEDYLEDYLRSKGEGDGLTFSIDDIEIYM